jgi:hypothetical protein
MARQCPQDVYRNVMDMAIDNWISVEAQQREGLLGMEALRRERLASCVPLLPGFTQLFFVALK